MSRLRTRVQRLEDRKVAGAGLEWFSAVRELLQRCTMKTNLSAG